MTIQGILSEVRAHWHEPERLLAQAHEPERLLTPARAPLPCPLGVSTRWGHLGIDGVCMTTRP